jgi:hypothetical protein
MLKMRRSLLSLGLVSAACAVLPGCAISVGGSKETDDCERRILKLNERVRLVEERLGVTQAPRPESQ